MAAMETAQDQQQPPPMKVVERLNPALQQQLNLDTVKTRAISLFKAISRILEELDALARLNATPKWYSTNMPFQFSPRFSSNPTFFFFFLWLIILGFCLYNRQDILGQFSMVNLELHNIVDDIKKVSKAFVVHPKNVNAENATSTFLISVHYPFLSQSFVWVSLAVLKHSG